MIMSVLFFCLHKQPDTPIDTKQVSTKATQSNPKQPKATQSNPKQPKANNDHFQHRLQGLHREHA